MKTALRSSRLAHGTATPTRRQAGDAALPLAPPAPPTPALPAAPSRRQAALPAPGQQIPKVCQGPGQPGLVSVLIPTYNRAYILASALDSVLAQGYAQMEVIVVDDGSTDGTGALLAHYVAQHGDRVRCIRQANAGLAAARNTGLAAARGEFIAFQDSDDLWAPWKLAAQVALMQRMPHVALTWTDMTAVSSTGELLQPLHLSTMYHAYQVLRKEDHMAQTQPLQQLWPACPEPLAATVCRWGDIEGAMFMGNLVHPPTALMRREAVQRAGGLDPAYAWSCEDYEFFWRVAAHGDGALIEAPGMLYRVDAPDQLTQPGLRLGVARGALKAFTERMRRMTHPVPSLPPSLLRARLLGAHRWLAEEELYSPQGSRLAALKSLAMVIRHGGASRRVLMQVAVAALLPRRARDWLRARKHAVRRQAAR